MTYLRSPMHVTVVRNPLRAVFAPFRDACFTLALLTDIAYWQTSFLMWQNFSAWLLLAGLVFGGIALIGGALDLLLRRDLRGRGHAWLHALGTVIVLALAIINSLVHAGDGWTAIVPGGLILSAVTVVLIVLLALIERRSVYRYDVGGDSHA